MSPFLPIYIDMNVHKQFDTVTLKIGKVPATDRAHNRCYQDKLLDYSGVGNASYVDSFENYTYIQS